MQLNMESSPSLTPAFTIFSVFAHLAVEIGPEDFMSNAHNLFNTLQQFDLGTGRKGTSTRCPRWKRPASARSRNCRCPSASCWNRCCAIATANGERSNVRALANWKPNEPRTEEIPFVVARIVLQDFTGVPLLVDLAAMRSAVARLGKNPKIIEPLVPVDLVVDHSVQVDFAGTPDALQQNLEMEFSATASATSSSSGACRRSTRSRWCRPASASCTR